MRVFNWFDKLLVGLLYIVLIFLVGVTFLQVVMRYFFNHPLTWAEELIGVVMIYFVLIGAAWGVRKSIHISMEVFAKWIFGEKAIIPVIIEISLYGMLAIFMIFYGRDIVELTRFQILPATGLKAADAYFALIVSGVIMLVFVLERFIYLFLRRGEIRR